MKKKLSQSDVKKIIKAWDSKLKDSGFVDIEDRRGYFIDRKTEYHLRLRVSFTSLVTYNNKMSYYSYARTIASHFKFESEEHRRIWELHSEGRSLSEIGVELKMSKQNVYNRFKKIIEILSQLDYSLLISNCANESSAPSKAIKRA